MPRVETDFSKRLVALRTERKVSQVAFGEALQIPRSTISGYEAEGKEPDYQTLCKMADFFGVSCDYLLGRTDERRPCDIVFRKDAGNFKKHYGRYAVKQRAYFAATGAQFAHQVTVQRKAVLVLLDADMKFSKV